MEDYDKSDNRGSDEGIYSGSASRMQLVIGSIARMRAQLGNDPPGRGDPTAQEGMGPPPLITDDESSDEDED